MVSSSEWKLCNENKNIERGTCVLLILVILWKREETSSGLCVEGGYLSTYHTGDYMKTNDDRNGAFEGMNGNCVKKTRVLKGCTYLVLGLVII